MRVEGEGERAVRGHAHERIDRAVRVTAQLERGAHRVDDERVLAEPRVEGLDGGALGQHALEERAADLVSDLQGTRNEERTSDKATAQRA